MLCGGGAVLAMTTGHIPIAIALTFLQLGFDLGYGWHKSCVRKELEIKLDRDLRN